MTDYFELFFLLVAIVIFYYTIGLVKDKALSILIILGCLLYLFVSLAVLGILTGVTILDVVFLTDHFPCCKIGGGVLIAYALIVKALLDITLTILLNKKR